MKTKKSNTVSNRNIKSNEITLFNQESLNLKNRINFDNDMISLTDLWKEAGSQSKKDPNTWLSREATTELIDSVCAFLNTPKMGVLKTKRGKGGGTYAHKQIALSYAKWLDTRLHVLVNEIFFQRIEEEKNPDLIVDRAIATYKKKGYDEKWINMRLKGKATRNEFTSCLAAHGVEHNGFSNCTNAIYRNLYGGTADVVRLKKQLPKNVSIRDNMSLDEISTIEFTEMLARNTIKANNFHGNGQCEIASDYASKIAAKAVIQSRQLLTINNSL